MDLYENLENSKTIFGSLYSGIVASIVAINIIIVFSIAFAKKNYKDGVVPDFTILQNSKVKEHVNKPFGKNLEILSGEPSQLKVNVNRRVNNPNDLSPSFANYLNN